MKSPWAQAPAWLLALAGHAAAPRGGGLDLDTLTCGTGEGPIFATLGPVPSGTGERNDILPSIIGREFRHGFTEEEVLEHGLAWAAQNGYDAGEMVRKVRSIARKEEAKASASQQTLSPLPCRVSVSVSEERSDRLDDYEERTKSASASGTDFFLLSSSASGDSEGQGRDFLLSSSAWPTLAEEAYHGLIGEIVKTVSPETEADPAGVLVSLLCGFGNAVGRGPHYVVNGGKHYANLYPCLAGLSSAGKGQAWDAAKYMLGFADAAWLKECVCLGLSSGEGLVKRVRDAETEQQPVKDDEGNLIGYESVIVEAGVKDKRLLCLETEFQRLLAVSRREGNTLSAILRSLWDFGAAEVLTKNPIRTTDAHVSILAHVTKEELDNVLASRVEMVNGFANRFLWCHVQERPDLPDGGNFAVLDRFAEPLASVLAKAKTIGEMRRTEEAAELWRERYGELRRAGNRVRACERARPQTLRLSMLYALADGSAEVGLAHLKAALAVWDYCEASARYLFQHDNKPHTPSVSDTEEQLWQRLLEAIYAKPGISRTELWNVAGRNVSGAKMDEELTYLEKNRLAHRRTAKTGGRDAEVWFPGPAPTGPDGYEERRKSSGEVAEGGDEERTKKEESPVSEGEGLSSFTKKEESPPSEPKPDFVLSSYRSAEPTPSPEPGPTPRQGEASGQQGSEREVVVVPDKPSPEAEAKPSPRTAAPCGESGPEQHHFKFEPSGGFGMASGEAKPCPLEPFQVLQHGTSEVRRACFNADKPPADAEEKRHRWQEAEAWFAAIPTDADAVKRWLDEEPKDEAIDGAEFQRRLEAAEADEEVEVDADGNVVKLTPLTA